MSGKDELNELLEKMTAEDITGKGVKHVLVDWDEVISALTQKDWIKVNGIVSLVNEMFPKKTAVYYSEVLRVLRQAHKSKEYHVTKKRIPSGPLKGVYYKIEEL